MKALPSEPVHNQILLYTGIRTFPALMLHHRQNAVPCNLDCLPHRLDLTRLLDGALAAYLTGNIRECGCRVPLSKFPCHPDTLGICILRIVPIQIHRNPLKPSAPHQKFRRFSHSPLDAICAARSRLASSGVNRFPVHRSASISGGSM